MAYYRELVEEKNEKKNRIIAIVTVLIVYVLMVVCFIFLGLTYQVPPPPEYGIEVDMSGGGGGGSNGNNSSSEKITSVTATQPSQKVATQKVEQTTAVANGNEKTSKIETPSTPTINEDALFKPRTQKGGGGEGTGEGSGSGSGIGPGTGSGTGGGNGSGYGPGNGDFWLDGRPVIKKAFPKSKNNIEGLVVVEFRADKTGTVIYAKAGVKGTTISDADIWRECEKAAKESKFKAKADAATEEKGFIRYRFIIQ